MTERPGPWSGRVFGVYLLGLLALQVTMAAKGLSIPFVDDLAYNHAAQRLAWHGDLYNEGMSNHFSGLDGHFAYPPFYAVLTAYWYRLVGSSGATATNLVYALTTMVAAACAGWVCRAWGFGRLASAVMPMSVIVSLGFLGWRPEPFALMLLVGGLLLMTIGVQSNRSGWARSGLAISMLGGLTSPSFVPFAAIATPILYAFVKARVEGRYPTLYALTKDLAIAGFGVGVVAVAWMAAHGIDVAAMLLDFLSIVSVYDRKAPALQLLAGALVVAAVLHWTRYRSAEHVTRRVALRFAFMGLLAALLLNVGTNPGRIYEVIWQATFVGAAGLAHVRSGLPTGEERKLMHGSSTLVALAMASVLLAPVGSALVQLADAVRRGAANDVPDVSMVERSIEERDPVRDSFAIDSFVYRYVLDAQLPPGALDYLFSRPATSDCSFFDREVFRPVDVAYVDRHTLDRYPFLRRLDYEDFPAVRRCGGDGEPGVSQGTPRRSFWRGEPLGRLWQLLTARGNRFRPPYGNREYVLLDVSSGQILDSF